MLYPLCKQQILSVLLLIFRISWSKVWNEIFRLPNTKIFLRRRNRWIMKQAIRLPRFLIRAFI